VAIPPIIDGYKTIAKQGVSNLKSIGKPLKKSDLFQKMPL
jgi:hypothetical protein